MSADIRFFQAAATIIPTLSIAVAVSGKYLSIDTHTKAKSKSNETVRYWLIFIAVFFFYAAALGERAALLVLAHNTATDRAAFSVWAALIVCGLLLLANVIGVQFYEFLIASGKPTEDSKRERGSRLLAGLFATLVVGAVALTILSGPV